MINVLAIISAILSVAMIIIHMVYATYTIKIDGRTAVFYGLKAVLWYRKHCGTKKTQYKLTTIQF